MSDPSEACLGTLAPFTALQVADANAARRDRDHNATLYTVYRTFGDVRPTDEVLALLERSWRIAPHLTPAGMS